MRTNEWQDQAICRSVGFGPFFDDSGMAESKPSVATRIRRWRGKQLCAICPVADTCLTHAENTGATYGVFGGLDQRERSLLRRANLPAKELADTARRLMIDGLSFRATAHRLGIPIGTLRAWLVAHPGGPASRLSLAEYAAWDDIEAGYPPDWVSRQHQLPLALAEELCRAMDRDEDYGGPKGKNRYGTETA